MLNSLDNSGIITIRSGGPTSKVGLSKKDLPEGQGPGQGYSSPFLRHEDSYLSNTRSEAFLVEKSEDGWVPTTHLEGSVDRFATAEKYGIWQDKLVTREPLLGKTQIVREKDGQIQDDEVCGLGYGDKNKLGHTLIGAELIEGHEPGKFSLRETMQNSADTFVERLFKLGESSDAFNRNELNNPINWEVR